MTKREKILAILQEHKTILEGTDMDVYESVKGKWFFTRYNEENGYFECIREFETAEELIEMIVGELSMEMNFTIDNEPELPVYFHKDVADLIS